MIEGKKIGVNVIPAVEIRANDAEILGYFIDFKNKNLIDTLSKISQRIENSVEEWCKKLNKAGYNITFKEIKEKFYKSEGINEFHVLYSLNFKKYGTITKLYKKLKNQKLTPNKIKEITVIQAINLIKKAGGVPVLAHPWLGDTNKNFKRMKSFVKAGLKGIEINNGDTAPLKKKSMNKKIKTIAKKYNLVLTSGSDYHGEKIIKIMVGNHNLGKNNCDEKIVDKLKGLSQSS
jgi:hypothetical protein